MMICFLNDRSLGEVRAKSQNHHQFYCQPGLFVQSIRTKPKTERELEHLY